MSAMIAVDRPRTQNAYFQLLERGYGEPEFSQIRMSEYHERMYAITAAKQYMDARCWYWHAERGAVIEMDADGMRFKAVCRDGAKTVLAEVRIQEML